VVKTVKAGGTTSAPLVLQWQRGVLNSLTQTSGGATMLDINLIREQPDTVRQSLTVRQLDAAPVDQVLELDKARRELIQEVETLKAERNNLSKEIARTKDAAERQSMIESSRGIGTRIDELDNKLRAVEERLNELMATIHNIPDERTPYGVDESENVVIKTVGEIPEYDFDPKPHWDLGPELGIINFEQGAKITGARFYVLSGAGARLQRALIAWMLDLHLRQGYTEKYPPFMVKSETLYGAGQLPKFRDNLYKDHEEDLWMVPTAEVPLTGLHMDEILDEDSLPRHYTAYTPCFRREKMSAGRDVRGIKRGHQFDKVEMYMFSKPEESSAEFDKMVADAEETCAGLGFTYRILQLCTGDLGFNASITYDIEVWAPGCKEWLEVSSISNVTDFQARRANIKYRPTQGGKARVVHTLNGSGLGMPRTLIAVLENYQQADGSVVVPEVLRPWMGGVEVIEPEG
jgi:seryl-tRNA synthetase